MSYGQSLFSSLSGGSRLGSSSIARNAGSILGDISSIERPTRDTSLGREFQDLLRGRTAELAQPDEAGILPTLITGARRLALPVLGGLAGAALDKLFGDDDDDDVRIAVPTRIPTTTTRAPATEQLLNALIERNMRTSPSNPLGRFAPGSRERPIDLSPTPVDESGNEQMIRDLLAGGDGKVRRPKLPPMPVTLPSGWTGRGRQSSVPQYSVDVDGKLVYWLPAGGAETFEKAAFKAKRHTHTRRTTTRKTHSHRGGHKRHTHRKRGTRRSKRSRAGMTAHQRKFAAAARKYGGKIPKGTDL